MYLKAKSYTIRSKLNVTHSILPGGKAGTSCVGLVYPSEETHGNKEKKKTCPAMQLSSTKTDQQERLWNQRFGRSS